MPKEIISISLSATPNPYLLADGMVNLPKIITLGERAAKLITPDGGNAQVLGAYYYPRKAKPIGYSAAKEKKPDVKYLSQRAVKLTFRKRLTTNANVKLLLPILAPKLPGVTPALAAQIKQAHAAIKRHVTKSESVKGKATKIRGAIREADQKVFESSVSLLKDLAAKAGLNEANIVESQSMFGKVVLVKLGPDNVISVGKSDMTRFRAAKKAASETPAA